jgi:hypothetical protein
MVVVKARRCRHAPQEAALYAVPIASPCAGTPIVPPSGDRSNYPSRHRGVTSEAEQGTQHIEAAERPHQRDQRGRQQRKLELGIDLVVHQEPRDVSPSARTQSRVRIAVAARCRSCGRGRGICGRAGAGVEPREEEAYVSTSASGGSACRSRWWARTREAPDSRRLWSGSRPTAAGRHERFWEHDARVSSAPQHQRFWWVIFFFCEAFYE